MTMQLRTAVLLAFLRPTAAVQYHVRCAKGTNANACPGQGVGRAADTSESHNVRCCSDTNLGGGWKKRGSCSVWVKSKINGSCHRNKDFAYAETLCAGAGARLCTMDEIDDLCTRGTGCSLDKKIIWSGTVVETGAPTESPTEAPTDAPTTSPTDAPTTSPTTSPTDAPSTSPTESPTDAPTTSPTDAPTTSPTTSPTDAPTDSPTNGPTAPTAFPTLDPTPEPTLTPTKEPTLAPTTDAPTFSTAPSVGIPAGPIVIDFNDMQFTYAPADACVGGPAGDRSAGASSHQCAQACSYLETCAGFAVVDGGCVLARDGPAGCAQPDGTFFTRAVDMGGFVR